MGQINPFGNEELLRIIAEATSDAGMGTGFSPDPGRGQFDPAEAVDQLDATRSRLVESLGEESGLPEASQPNVAQGALSAGLATLGDVLFSLGRGIGQPSSRFSQTLSEMQLRRSTLENRQNLERTRFEDQRTSRIQDRIASIDMQKAEHQFRLEVAKEKIAREAEERKVEVERLETAATLRTKRAQDANIVNDMVTVGLEPPPEAFNSEGIAELTPELARDLAASTARKRSFDSFGKGGGGGGGGGAPKNLALETVRDLRTGIRQLEVGFPDEKTNEPGLSLSQEIEGMLRAGGDPAEIVKQIEEDYIRNAVSASEATIALVPGGMESIELDLKETIQRAMFIAQAVIKADPAPGKRKKFDPDPVSLEDVLDDFKETVRNPPRVGSPTGRGGQQRVSAPPRQASPQISDIGSTAPRNLGPPGLDPGLGPPLLDPSTLVGPGTAPAPPSQRNLGPAGPDPLIAEFVGPPPGAPSPAPREPTGVTPSRGGLTLGAPSNPSESTIRELRSQTTRESQNEHTLLRIKDIFDQNPVLARNLFAESNPKFQQFVRQFDPTFFESLLSGG